MLIIVIMVLLLKIVFVKIIKLIMKINQMVYIKNVCVKELIVSFLNKKYV